MSWTAWIHNILTEEIPDDQGGGETEKTAPPSSGEATSSAKPSKADAAPVDKKAYDIIFKATQDEDSLFSKFLEMLPPTDLIAEEKKRFQTAVAYLRKQVKEATPEKIILAIQKQVGALKGEKEKFDKALTQRRQVVEQMEKEHQALTERIAELQKEIQQVQNERDAAQAKIELEKQKIVKSQEGFDAALLAVENDLNTQREKVKNFLK
jgi:septal ring factor EnvC (AmiA/AmiB activator)